MKLDILDGVTSLVDKSLVRPVSRESEMARYAMLETVREYGLEQLGRLGEIEAVQAEHAEVVTRFVGRHADRSLPSSFTSTGLLTAEADNVRAALG